MTTTTEQYAITYIREEWSAPYETNPDELVFGRMTLAPIALDELESWLEGIMPGTYEFTRPNGDTFLIVVGK